MSEFFGRSDKQEQLKQIVLALHAGKSVPELKAEFSEILKGLSAEEIAMMEQSLIDEGFGVESIMSLCDVHVEVFEDELKKQKDEHMLPGHPIYTYREENRELERRLKQFESAVKNIKKDEQAREEALTLLDDIKQIEKHYQRKENQLFAKLEEVGFTGPTSVMWGKHDEVRDAMKACREVLNTEADPKVIKKAGSAMINGMKNMIFMEEKILFPTSIKRLDPITWAHIHAEEPEIGFSWIRPGSTWDPGIAIRRSVRGDIPASSQGVLDPDEPTIPLDEGALTNKQLNLMLKRLPFDITYVDDQDTVRYYSATDDRIFPRTPAIIGRAVEKCHPPKSVHVVQKIVESFRNKEKDKAMFWLDFGGKKVMITYYPIYDEQGSYAGVIEVSQDITEIQQLEGEHRLLDW
jgi:uncharacterized protein